MKMMIVLKESSSLIYFVTFSVQNSEFFSVFRSKPPSPPSQSQALMSAVENDGKLTFWMAAKGFAGNKDFIFVLISFGINYGLWNCYGVLFNQMYTAYFPVSNLDFMILPEKAAKCRKT